MILDEAYDSEMRQKKLWLMVLAGLALAWLATAGLYLSGVFSYPWGWLILLVLAGWAWFKVRDNG